MTVRALPARPARGRLLVLLAAVLLLTGLVVPSLPRLGAVPAAAADCPCSIWSSTATPSNPSDSDTAAVELGVKLRSDVAGFITGIRFYKGTGNTGTHVGNLWTTDGTKLASVTFGPETATGWQEARFDSPVAVTANTTYVASYYAPNGRYAGDAGAFRTAGVDNGPLHALADGVDGANGVYRYGAGGGFPANTWESSNYWVDVVFETSLSDTSPPKLIDRSPAADSTGVSVDSAVSASFNEPVSAATITVAGPASAVSGTSSYDAGLRRLTFTPSATLATSTTYTVTVSGAKDAADNTMAPATWTFTTAATADGCPCSLFPSTAVPANASVADDSAVELGVRFRSDRAGFVTGLRFFKGAGNTGTHVGNLWSADGTSLARASFGTESASGWQQVMFASPVPVSTGTDYVASYYAPNGNYAANGGYFGSPRTSAPLSAPASSSATPNGVYRYGASGFPSSTFNATNYWVDVVFETTAVDRTPPKVVGRSPSDGDTSVGTGAAVSATFDEAVVPGDIVLTLRTTSGTAVAGTVSYDAPSRTATFAPTNPLATSTSYTASVSATDAAGNAMTAVTWSFTTQAPPPPPPTTPGPVLVVASPTAGFARYLPEILKTEGLNEHETASPSTALTTAGLSPYDVVILGETPLTASQVTALTDWVAAGGNLIAMRPDKQLAGLLGLTAVTSTPTTLADGYLQVNTATAPGSGIAGATMQFHGAADRYTLNGASSVATLYSNASTTTNQPAVTLRSVGTTGGQAAAFTYDLARSIVYTRQGNPAFAGQERDNQAPIRSDDMFWGSTATNGYVNLNKVAIPQADEQQRLLANLVQTMNQDKKPLPRFWYFPRMSKAVVVATGDDHGNNGTAGRYDQYAANSAPGCSVVLWSCLRFSSYVYPSTPLPAAQAQAYEAQGFETGAHVSSNCGNFTASGLPGLYATQLGQWEAAFSGVPKATTSRFHCIVYSDWASQPKVGAANGIEMDTNYYYWPGSWVGNRPGFMTGSGMPMRFADTDGTVLGSYQAATQMTDESGQSYPFTPNSLIDNATGANGYYGAFVANVHTDQATIYESDQLISSAQARGVPVISAEQLLTWVKGRDASRFTDVAWSGGTLRFGLTKAAGAEGLTALVPTAGPGGSTLSGLSVGGAPVTFTKQTVKGIEYAVFTAASGSWSATYSGGSAGPTATAGDTQLRTASSEQATASSADPSTADTSDGVHVRGPQTKGSSGGTKAAPTANATDTTAPTLSDVEVKSLPDGTATVSWRTSEGADSQVSYGRRADALHEVRSDDELVTEHSVVLTDLTPGATYSYSVRSSDASGNAVSSPVALRFVQSAAGVADSTAPSLKVGTRDAAAYVGSRKDGELQLSGDDQADFDTPQLPSRWTTEAEGGGRTTVYGGKMKVDGTRAMGPAVSGSRTLDMGLTFTGGDQFAGLAAGVSGPWAMFAGRAGELFASVHDGKTRTDTPLPKILVGSPHRYKVEWTASGVTMSVDDGVVASGAVTPSKQVRPMVRDLKGDDAPLTVDWLRQSAFKPSSTYVSRVLDAQQMVTWDRMTLHADVPAGTSLQVSVRTGSKRGPDATWSAWTPLSGPGARVPGGGRYLQYRVHLATTNPARTPVVHAIGFTHNGTLPRHEGEVR